MRYMIIVKASRDSEAGAKPTDALFARMAAYHEALGKAGILVDASGLQATSKGWRVEVHGEHRSIVDGPFAETKELIAGYTIIRVKSEQQARDWTARFPNPNLDDGPWHIEVRRMFELEYFEPNPAVDVFRKLAGNGRPVGA
ncbi:MAG TPA: YciI family protein [Steroidobacteraceae bacterium]|nr:YciI family protein [Steroidobacteraceae bacterium]